MTTQNCRATIPERFLDLLESRVLAHVATIGPSDEPQSNPVWFGWDGYLEVRGVVDRIEEDPDLDFINSISEKHLGIYQYQNHRPGEELVVVFVSPEHTTQKNG